MTDGDIEMDLVTAKSLQNLDPAYFAMVMATGIVSIHAHLLDIPLVCWPLLGIGSFAYLILAILLSVGMAKHLSGLIAEIACQCRDPKVFSLVAATCVLGIQGVQLANNRLLGLSLWLLGLLLWIALMGVFWLLAITNESKPPLREAVHGSWLIIVVATQSLAVLGSLLAPVFPSWEERLAFLSLMFYLFGGALYLMFIGLIVYRLIFVALMRAEFTPAYWINMGAAAITTLAGASLILHGAQWHCLREILPFMEGLTLLFWAVGTAWIPLLTLMEIWRYLYRRYPVAYEVEQWCMVFPLGMYGVCTWQLEKAMDLPFLASLSKIFLAVALIAWAVVFMGMIRRLGKTLSCRTVENG